MWFCVALGISGILQICSGDAGVKYCKQVLKPLLSLLKPFSDDVETCKAQSWRRPVVSHQPTVQIVAAMKKAKVERLVVLPLGSPNRRVPTVFEGPVRDPGSNMKRSALVKCHTKSATCLKTHNSIFICSVLSNEMTAPGMKGVLFTLSHPNCVHLIARVLLSAVGSLRATRSPKRSAMMRQGSVHVVCLLMCHGLTDVNEPIVPWLRSS